MINPNICSKGQEQHLGTKLRTNLQILRLAREDTQAYLYKAVSPSQIFQANKPIFAGKPGT
jgi:hypothetical protein